MMSITPVTLMVYSLDRTEADGRYCVLLDCCDQLMILSHGPASMKCENRQKHGHDGASRPKKLRRR